MAVGISSSGIVPAGLAEWPACGAEAAPLVVPDDGLYELVDGKLVEKQVGAQQVEIANILGEWIGSFARPRRLGRALVEMVFRIDPAKNLQRRPDAAFVSDARWPFRKRVPDVPVWDMVPDLAIEVISPNNSADEVEDKKLEYFRAGVGQVWVVYPRQRLCTSARRPPRYGSWSGTRNSRAATCCPASACRCPPCSTMSRRPSDGIGGPGSARRSIDDFSPPESPPRCRISPRCRRPPWTIFADRLRRETRPRSPSTRGCAGSMRPTPACTRSSRSASSCRDRP